MKHETQPRNDSLSLNHVVAEVVDGFLREEKTGRDLRLTVKDDSGKDLLHIEISEPRPKP